MLKREITYENLDGQMVTKEFMFNLSKSDLIGMEMTTAKGGGYQESMQRIIDSQDGKAIMEEFERIILLSVGYRDGDSFVKTEEYRQRFRQSGAYDELFIELVTNAEAGAKFINSVIPAHLAEQVRNMPRPGQPQDHLPKEQPMNVFDQQAQQQAPTPAAPVPAESPEPSAPTEAPQPETPVGLTRREVREHQDAPIFPPYDN